MVSDRLLPPESGRRYEDAPILRLDAKTALLAAALFGGGTIGGGALSLNSHRLPPEVVESIGDTKRVVELLREQLAAINLRLAAMSANGDGTERETKRLAQRIEDQERRIRELELQMPRRAMAR